MTENGTGATRRGLSWRERLYVGNGALDIVGTRKRFYAAFGLLVLGCIAVMAFRGFNFGIDFDGGTKIQMPAEGARGTISVDAAKSAFKDVVPGDPEVQAVGTGQAASIQIRTDQLSTAEVSEVKDSLFEKLQPIASNGQPSKEAISDSAVSATWGGEISQKAGIGLLIFLVLVAAFLTFYFERWMAVSAIIALAHDLIVTAGIYALIGFEVTPATVIGLLTILGFSLYDTVVVFDKVKENTRGLLSLTRRTYGEAANLAVNQTLMRSINTSLIALLPVTGLLIVGVGVLGVGTLSDLALVQLVGLIAGAVSSIFLATPMLVDMKMTEKPYQQQAARVLNRRKSNRAAAEGDEVESAPDDDEIRAEERRERAMAAAASTPARPGKQGTQRRGQPSGKRQGGGQGGVSRQGGSGQGGKGGRPSGKRQR